jgi:Uncharacterized protein conserved in bacteria (DUF2188)
MGLVPPSEMTNIQVGAGRRFQRRGPRGERLTLAETEPIPVHEEDGGWQVDYGSYVQEYHRSREEAIEEATAAVARENQELTIENAEPTG